MTVVKAELWKLGQLRPKARVRFRRCTPDAAQRAEAALEAALAGFGRSVLPPAVEDAADRRDGGDGRFAPARLGDGAILASRAADGARPAVVYRRAGDCNLLVEYGPPVLDLELRLRVHALMQSLAALALPGIIDLTPGIRSLQVHYDACRLPLVRLIDLLMGAEESLAAIDSLEIASRIVHLPLSWDDESTRLAIEKYMQSVRADAPWCPSNIEFIRRINGLDDVEDVKRIVFAASYLVLGLGDVYLGAPVATPIDPRHRLVTTKYNPARTWTPENAVGIGGAYLCVYGMEGPGGYQFLGRTCQMWNTYRQTASFEPGKPWLLRFFDQLRFYPVTHAELEEFRGDFLNGRARLETSDAVFRLRDYRRLLSEEAVSIGAHKARQQAAFEAERRRWEATGQIGYGAELPASTAPDERTELPEGCVVVASPVSGSIWKIAVSPGQVVKSGDILVLVESMKMELPVIAPGDGMIVQVLCAEGRAVEAAQILLSFRPHAESGDIECV